MPRRALRPAALLTVIALSACADATGPDRRPMSVRWMEWPSQVTTARPGMLRVLTSVTCADLHLATSVAGSRIVVHTEISPRGPDCHDVGRTVDTLIPLPTLTGDPAYYWIEALIYDAPASTTRQHTFGRLRLGTTVDPTLSVGGKAALYAETNGCGIAVVGTPTYGTMNLPSDSATWHAREVLLRGVRESQPAAPCADAVTIARYGAPLPALRVTHLELPLY